MTPLTCVWLMLSAAPMAEAWPYAATPAPDGGVEYRFDLTAIKRSAGSPDALEAWGPARVRDFLSRLPAQVKVRLAPARLELRGGRWESSAPLAVAPARVSTRPFAQSDPLGRAPPARLRPALHVEEPKLLLSAEVVAWQVRRLEDSALAAEELDAERSRRRLWSRLASAATQRARTDQGAAREGAVLLAARLLAANACLDAAALEVAARRAPEVATAARAELEALSKDPSMRPSTAPWTWRRELSCAWTRDRALMRPFETSLGGAAATLSFFAALDADPGLRELEEGLRRRSARFLGAPVAEPLETWRRLAGGRAQEAIEDLSTFLERLPPSLRQPPGPLSPPATPFVAFVRSLGPVACGTVWDELTSAVEDGRVAPTAAQWPAAREAALVPLVASEFLEDVAGDSAWRRSLHGAFAGLLGGVEVARGEVVALDEVAAVTSEATDLSVRLRAPPWLEVEPPAGVYGRLAESLLALEAALVAEGLGRLERPAPQSGTVLAEVRRLVPILRGLEAIARGAGGQPAERAAARRYLASWTAEPELRSDVRAASALPGSCEGDRHHGVLLGVARRELSVAFAEAPGVEVVGEEGRFDVDTSARQSYLVPAFDTLAVTATPSTAPLDRTTVRALVDAAGRRRDAAAASVQEAVRAPSSRSLVPSRSLAE